MSWRLWTTVPISRSQRQPKVIDTAILARRDHTLKTKQKRNYDQHHGIRELLDYGDIVWVLDCVIKAVVGEQVAPRSDELVTGRGTATRTNRHDLLKMPGMIWKLINKRIKHHQKKQLCQIQVLSAGEAKNPILRFITIWARCNNHFEGEMWCNSYLT